MKKLALLTTTIACAFCATAFAQDPAVVTPPPVAEVHNAICLAGDTCLTGVSAGIVAGFSILVTVATLLAKVVKDKESFLGKIIDKIANIKIKK